MRQGVLLGSIAAVSLIGAVTGVVLHRSSSPDDGRRQAQMASLSPERLAADNSPPAVAGPVAEARPVVPPTFDIVKVGPTGTAVIAGRAEPGSTVKVRDGDTIIGEATVDARGEWVLVPDRPIGAGDRLLSLEASSRGGGAITKSDETVALSIPQAVPGRQGETALAVVLPQGGRGARVLQRPDRGLSDNPGSLSVDAVQHDTQGRMALVGRAQPGATVRIYLGEEPIATATADANGSWSATSMKTSNSGRIELRLDQLGEDGKLAQRIVMPLAQVAATGPGKSYVVQPGNSLWQIARQTYGNGVHYLIIYSGNPGQIKDPDRIYPGQVFKLPKS